MESPLSYYQKCSFCGEYNPFPSQNAASSPIGAFCAHCSKIPKPEQNPGHPIWTFCPVCRELLPHPARQEHITRHRQYRTPHFIPCEALFWYRHSLTL